MMPTEMFKTEEAWSAYGYLSSYRNPKDLLVQCDRLTELFSGLGFPSLCPLRVIERRKIVPPPNAEGFFAIPNWVKRPDIFGHSYYKALQKVLDTIKATRSSGLNNYLEGYIDPEHLRQMTRTEEFFHELIEAQGNPDILIVAAQFGIRHRGRSVRRAREVMEKTPGEFALGAFAVGCMLLTHPERLMNENDLFIDCCDECDSHDISHVPFWRSPFFAYDFQLEFSTSVINDAHEHYGAASGFIPQE